MLSTKEALPPLLLLATILAGGLLWHESENVPQFGRVISSGQIDVGGPFRLVDQDGKLRSSTDFHGKYQLIYFGYSYCPDVCPTTLEVIAGALDNLGLDANRIVPIFITVDPERDTPEVLKKYLAAFGHQFVGLTGSATQIAAAEREYRVHVQKHPLKDGSYGMDHTSVIYFMGPTGRIVSFYDEALSPGDLASSLKRLL